MNLDASQQLNQCYQLGGILAGPVADSIQHVVACMVNGAGDCHVSKMVSAPSLAVPH